MKICYDCGIGSKNSLGFGMVEEIGKNNQKKIK
jgi:CRISPR/Cas system endoribonuclease Cas6 (RAMP superfamily)